jgi:hypothetical protein
MGRRRGDNTKRGNELRNARRFGVASAETH